MKKSVWITVLEKNEGLGRMVFEEAARYGLNPTGHFWEDDLKSMAWAGAIPEMTKDSCSAWLILGRASRFGETATRMGLSLLALAVQASQGHRFPILISPSGGKIDAAGLPTPLRDAEIVTAGLGARTVARANAKKTGEIPDYRLAVHPLPGMGLWFEAGPARNPWNGAFLGSAGSAEAVPDAHGVGLAGAIPQTSTLHYPTRGMKVSLRDREYTAWGVRNELSPADSYYVRLTGTPEALIFGPFPDEDDAEVLTVSLV